jgi:hypothetical protein
MTEVAVVGIDIGKTSFHLIGLDVAGSIQWKKKLSRSQLMRHMAALPRCLVGMEACCGALMMPRFSGHEFRPFVVRPVPGSCIRERSGSAAGYSSLRYTRIVRVWHPRGSAIVVGGRVRP